MRGGDDAVVRDDRSAAIGDVVVHPVPNREPDDAHTAGRVAADDGGVRLIHVLVIGGARRHSQDDAARHGAQDTSFRKS